MGWTIKYARVGNAKPVYVAINEDNLTAMTDSVKGVADITGRSVKGVRIACKEAREDGMSEYLL